MKQLTATDSTCVSWILNIDNLGQNNCRSFQHIDIIFLIKIKNRFEIQKLTN